jgi:hypothetical protein
MMKYISVFVFASLAVSSVMAQGGPHGGHGHEEYGPAKYHYEYAIKDDYRYVYIVRN